MNNIVNKFIMILSLIIKCIVLKRLEKIENIIVKIIVALLLLFSLILLILFLILLMMYTFRWNNLIT